MSTYNLNKMFNPKGVAIIGASEKPGSVGCAIMKNLFAGRDKYPLFPVNPHHKKVFDLTSYAAVSDIGSPVDMAVIATPIHIVPQIIDACGKAGVAGAVIVSSGGREIGEPGCEIEKQIIENARKYDLRIIGPNCLGIVNTALSLNASFAHLSPLPGNIAFLSQSGAVCTSVLDLANRENVGFSHFVSLGSMADVDFADMIDYFGSVRSVGSIVMYMENISNVRNFMSAARAVSRIKPIIVLKSGRSFAGARVAASHTGAMAKEDALYDTAFQRAGILRVSEFEELFDCAEFLAKQRRPAGPGLTILSNAGGPGVMAADALLLICSPAGTMDTHDLATSLVPHIKTFPCPVFTAWIGGDNVAKARQVFNQAGIVTYESAERSVRAFKNLYEYGKNIERLTQIPIRTDTILTIHRETAQKIIDSAVGAKNNCLLENNAKELLNAYGIPVNETKIAEQTGVSVQAMHDAADYELIIGARKDEQFGPVILFGMGGIFTEVFKDISMGLPPLNPMLARHLIEKTKISTVLKGFRNIPKINMEQLEELLIRISRMVTDFPEIQALDINPLRVKDGIITAVDARVFLGPAPIAAPMHLIISSYPWQFESQGTTVDGQQFHIRPIRPSDADLLIDHFHSLSSRSIYMRFFSPLKQLSKEMLIKLTQIDYDREIALVALMGKDKEVKMIGVSRIIFYPDKIQSEFALAISDDWQGKGIGASLLTQCIKAAQQMKIKRIIGVVLAENSQMLKLGRKLGFQINRVPGAGEYELIIECDDLTIA